MRMASEALLPALKLLHIAALIFWIGPTLGAWWLLLAGTRHFGEPTPVSYFLYRAFLKTLWLEHAALGVLIASGFALAYYNQAFGWTWLQAKLILIVLVVVPLESVDIWLSHVRLPQLFAADRVPLSYTRVEKRLLGFYHGCFSRLALWVLPPTVLIIMWLALAKPF